MEHRDHPLLPEDASVSHRIGSQQFIFFQHLKIIIPLTDGLPGVQQGLALFIVVFQYGMA